MELIVHFGGLGTVRNKVSDLFYLRFISSLKAWRIMEYKLRVAGKDERNVDIMDSTLKIGVGNIKFEEQRANYIYGWLDLIVMA